ncbi:hypothetical protein NDU88_002296 [Pleurodeles waltl]|uniref:Uncharacterized protein n=1 Tax=Pleurodeles waltl TaxID=8319 RepID=A0AAV7UY04_PLEWA|nr:hypothetical protein NDU88_002296 [Pleurodeles waltl]
MTGEPKALGAVQIMIWVIHVILGGILCSLQYLPMSVFSGVVFWGAVSFFISGGLSVAAAARKNGSTCLVRGSLGMNIVSAIVAGTAFIIYSFDLAAPPYFYYSCSSFYSSYDWNYTNPRPCPTVSTTTVR